MSSAPKSSASRRIIRSRCGSGPFSLHNRGLALSARQRRRHTDDVAVGVGDHEVAVAPGAIIRKLQDARTERFGAFEKIIEIAVDPELRLHGRPEPVWRLIA